MENNVNNSCLMLAYALYTPITVSCIFDESDLVATEPESHITLLYAKSQVIPRDTLMDEIYTILGDEEAEQFYECLKETQDGRVFDHFELGLFENDSDFLVLKLLKTDPLYSSLVLINRALRTKYGVPADYTYTPHLTLATLKSGSGRGYLESEKLRLALSHSTVDPEDLVVSYGPTGGPDREKYNLTTFHAVSRYFREAELKKEE